MHGTDTIIQPKQASLEGQVRRFGPLGVLYEVLGCANEGYATIKVIHSGETLDYPVAAILADPLH